MGCNGGVQFARGWSDCLKTMIEDMIPPKMLAKITDTLSSVDLPLCATCRLRFLRYILLLQNLVQPLALLDRRRENLTAAIFQAPRLRVWYIQSDLRLEILQCSVASTGTRRCRVECQIARRICQDLAEWRCRDPWQWQFLTLSFERGLADS